MKVLIVGGCGFVGSHLALYLSQQGHEVSVVDNHSREGSRRHQTRIGSKVAVEIGPIQDSVLMRHYAQVKKPDVILNCAAQSRSMQGMEEPYVDFHSNVVSTHACLEIARQSGAALIHWSTNKVYSGDVINGYYTYTEETQLRHSSKDTIGSGLSEGPLSQHRTIYGATKLASEVLINEWANIFGIKTIINRFSCIAGPHQWGCSDQGWVAKWVINNELGIPLKYIGWKGKQVRDVLHINDLCVLIKKQIQRICQLKKIRDNNTQSNCRTFNVGGGPKNTLSLRECEAICSSISGKYSNVLEVVHPRFADQKVFVSNIDEVCKEFDWQPVIDPESTIKSIHSWIIAHRSEVAEFYS